jgi:hypothetical protein
MRADVRLLQQQVAAQPTATQFQTLSNDVRGLDARLRSIERVVYGGGE